MDQKSECASLSELVASLRRTLSEKSSSQPVDHDQLAGHSSGSREWDELRKQMSEVTLAENTERAAAEKHQEDLKKVKRSMEKLRRRSQTSGTSRTSRSGLDFAE